LKNDIKDQKIGKQKKIGIILTIIINLLIVGFLIILGVRSDTSGIQKVPLKSISFWFIGLGAALFGVAVLSDYIKYKRMIMATEGKLLKQASFVCPMIGKYYDNITPFGAGGQPFQIHYLKKQGMTTGTSASVPIAGLTTQQFAFIIIATVVFIVNRSIPAINNKADIRVLAYVGLFMYLLLPLCVILFAIIPKQFSRFVSWCAKLLGKMHIIKDTEKATESIYSVLNEYVTSLKTMAKRPMLLIKLMACSFVYQFAIMSIPFCMLRAFGGEGDWWTIFSLTVYIYAAITVIPTPGNALAAEVSFHRIFEPLEGGFLVWAMVIWRILVYYSWLVIGFTLVMRNTVSKTKKKKKPVPDGAMNVALANDLYYPSVDGVVRTVDAYATQMTEKGDKVCVICPKGYKSYVDNEKYSVFRVPTMRLPFFQFPFSLPFVSVKTYKYFKEHKFDLIHVHSPFAVGNIALKLGRKFNIPVIATFHSKYYDDTLHITHSKLIARFVTSKIVDFYCKVDAVWACSKSTAETLHSYGYNGEITVMENGVEDMPKGDILEMEKAAKERFSIPDGKKILLFVGQQIWHKNIRLVLDTTKEIASTYPDVLTIIAGTGYDEHDIKKYAEEIGVSDRVIFTGIIDDRSVLFGLYKTADVFFFPSVYDNAPLVLREAALAATPALLVDGSNAAEVIEDGVNGFVADNNVEAMAKKIREILSRDDIADIGERAKETIPIMWSEIVDRVKEQYKKDFGE